MELNHLKYFFEVARFKSFSRAARALRISQPGISKAIKQLELEQGVILLNRSRGGKVTLTEKGTLLLATCSRVFEELTRGQMQLQDVSQEITGEINVGASDNLCNYLLPEFISRFLMRYPKIEMRIFNGTAESIQKELGAGKIDFGLFFTPVTHPKWLVVKLAEVEFSIVANKKMTLSGVSKLNYIGSRLSDYADPYPVLKMLRTVGISPKARVETNSQETQKRLVLAGAGYAMIPRFMVSAETRSKKLHVLKVSRPLSLPILAVQDRNIQLPRAAGIFMAELRDHLAGKLLNRP